MAQLSQLEGFSVVKVVTAITPIIRSVSVVSVVPAFRDVPVFSATDMKCSVPLT